MCAATTLHNATADVVYTHPTSGAVLLLGGVAAATDVVSLEGRGCTRLVTVMHELPDSPYPLPAHWRRYHVGVRDDNETKLGPHIPGAVECIGGWLVEGHSVLVHCSSGVSRSAALVLAFLISRRPAPALTLRDAWAQVYEQRRVICPGRLFFAELQELEREVRGEVSMSDALYYAYSLRMLLPPRVALDACVAAVEAHGWENDYALMSAAESLM
eukprot:TRINITY_DN9005_c0_g1_i1.p1 TRINITY_DN9005_c0_g1~~TRINITY_DN9005_c0_g1_i1.p1  ORF type:complete len:215 (-),score=44.20 TRINITY_DN9005_c0_g1_i1:212-856(-)